MSDDTTVHTQPDPIDSAVKKIVSATPSRVPEAASSPAPPSFKGWTPNQIRCYNNKPKPEHRIVYQHKVEALLEAKAARNIAKVTRTA